MERYGAMAKFGSDVLGAWVLKCNPQMWDIVAFMADGNRVIDGWSVQDNVRAKNMVSGEPVVLWVSGSSSTIEAGAWGVGQVAGPAAPGSPDKYWLAKPGSLYVPLDLRIDRCLVPRDAAKQSPVLSGSELIRMPQMSNPVMLTATEWTEFQRVLAAHP